MHQPPANLFRRRVRAQPSDQSHHGFFCVYADPRSHARFVLFRPPFRLSLAVALGFTEIAQPHRARVHRVQRPERSRHLLVHRSATTLRAFLHARLQINIPIDVRHDVKGLAQHARVLAQRERVGRRHVRRTQRPHHGVFALDRVRGLQQRSRRFLSHDVRPADVTAARQREDLIRRVRLSVRKLVDVERRARAREPGYARATEAQKRGLVDRVATFPHRARRSVGTALERGLVLLVITRDGDGRYESLGWRASGVHR